MSRYNHLPAGPGDMAADHADLASIRSQQQPFIAQGGDTEYSASKYVSVIEASTSGLLSTSQPKFKTPATQLEDDLPFWQAVRRFPKIVAYCLAIVLIIGGVGLSIVVGGAVTGSGQFKEDYGQRYNGEQIIPKTFLTIWQALPPVGSAIGCITAGWLQGRIGRKFTIMIGSVIAGIAVALIFFSHLAPDQDMMRIVYAAGLCVQGIANGFLQIACTTYVSEVAPTALQGPAMAMFPTFMLFGQILGSLVIWQTSEIDGKLSYLICFGVQWIVAIVGFIVSCIMPESPGYLIRRGQEARAMKAARRLFAPKTNPNTALEKIRAIVIEDMALTAHATYISCFRGPDLRRTLLSLLVACLPSLFGLDLLANSVYFVQMLGLPEEMTNMVLIAGLVVAMLATGTGAWIMGRVGMRRVSLISLILTALAWAGMGVSGFWRGDIPAWIGAGIIIAVLAICGLGVWPASFAYLGMTSSLQLRALTQGLAGVVSQGTSAIMAGVGPQIYNRDGLDLGAKFGFVYTFLCTVAVVLSFFFLPEMSDRSVTEIDHMFALKLPARKFKNYRTASTDDAREETIPLATN